MTVMTAGTGGFGGDAAATGPNAGYDPVLKFRNKLKKSKEDKKLVAPGNKLGESREVPTHTPRTNAFQYKVTIPEVGETVIFATSPAELSRKLRMVIAPQHRGDVKIERIMPGEAGKFFMDKRMKHMRNVKEQADQQMKQQMAQQKIAIEKKKIMMKKQELQKQLQLKTQQLKKQARAGAEQDATR